MKIKSLTKNISIIFMLSAMLSGCCLFGNEDTGNGGGNSNNQGGGNGGGNQGGGGNNEGGNGGESGGGGGGGEPKEITITFDVNGIDETVPPIIKVLPGRSIELPTLTSDKFLYWSTSADGMGTRYLETATFNESVTLYAIGLPDDAYKIIYMLDGGKNNIDNPFYLEMGQTSQTLLEPTKDRFSFAGWYTDEACTENQVTQITQTTQESIVLYAKWIVNKAAITITQNEPEINLQQVTNGTTVTFTADDSFDKYIWNIDGVKQSETSSTFTIYTSNLEIGINYKIAVIVFKEGQY
ncbi:MAG: InlB B-repeat-containing protein, partial [Spirochaetota bacterium]|nr:InlB B-repeat-containing protein [Spirochaetota bacterium]